jgi:hypothetical protein
LRGPIPFSIEQSGEPKSMESRLQSLISAWLDHEVLSSAEATEHLAIVKRWYYRSNPIGEIFFADEKGAWPWRRMVRGIGRVYSGEKPQESATFSATQIEIPPS